MLENLIKFICREDYIKNNQDILPIPAKTNIPEWFKKLEHSTQKKTIKGCMPFLDSLTAGYLLKMPVDYHIIHNIEVEGEKRTGHMVGLKWDPAMSPGLNLNWDGKEESHLYQQLEGSPYVEKNKKLKFHKILNPWVIKTPPGYSTLFVPPLNNADDRFSIIPGIVDTDTFEKEINFPFVVNGDKYPILESTIKVGTPYVQVIPFKREKWKMKIENRETKKFNEDSFYYFKYWMDNYKKRFWSKKSWK